MLTLTQLKALNAVSNAAEFAAASKLGQGDALKEDDSDANKERVGANFSHYIELLVDAIYDAIAADVPTDQAFKIARESADQEWGRLQTTLERKGIRDKVTDHGDSAILDDIADSIQARLSTP